MKKKVCMIVQDKMVKGGIAAVISGYYGSKLEQKFDITYIESYKDGGKFSKLLKGISGYIKFVITCLANRPDIVHIHSSFGPSFYRKLPFIYIAYGLKIPIINHIHGADFNEFYEEATVNKKRLIKSVYNKCTILIALSDEWKNRLNKIVSNDKIYVIENYSVLHEDALKERCSRSSNHKVLFLGEIGYRKGCYDIPKVVSEVVKDISDTIFILAGAGSDRDESKIKELVKKFGVEKNVVFPGWVRDAEKDKLLREADVFFLPSYNEGMPMSILDAMGYGLPIVSTNVGGIPKIVQTGKNGICLEPGNILAMSKAIELLLENKRKDASISSYRIVEDNYSLEQHLNKLELCYRIVSDN